MEVFLDMTGFQEMRMRRQPHGSDTINRAYPDTPGKTFNNSIACRAGARAAGSSFRFGLAFSRSTLCFGSVRFRLGRSVFVFEIRRIPATAFQLETCRRNHFVE